MSVEAGTSDPLPFFGVPPPSTYDPPPAPRLHVHRHLFRHRLHHGSPAPVRPGGRWRDDLERGRRIGRRVLAEHPCPFPACQIGRMGGDAKPCPRHHRCHRNTRFSCGTRCGGDIHRCRGEKFFAPTSNFAPTPDVTHRDVITDRYDADHRIHGQGFQNRRDELVPPTFLRVRNLATQLLGTPGSNG